VDADLSKYFDTIPHDELLKSVERRVSDHKVLWLIRAWLKSPVQEKNANGRTVIAGGKKTRIGTPQGGVISPLLANIYFRRFLKAWDELGWGQKFRSRIVNYADDFVILTQWRAKAALKAAQALLRKLGLNLNESKTRTVNVWDNSFDFLGYTFGKYHRWGGKAFLSQAPSQKNLKAYRESIREETGADRTCKTAEQVAQRLNWITRGFWNYFNQGTNSRMKHNLDNYLWNRMKQWVCRKHRKLKAKERYGVIQTATAQLVLGRDISNRRWLANAARFVPVKS
jgi:RNA-directed DNA polymerase